MESAGKAIASAGSELLAAAAGVGGWFFVTSAIAAIGRPDVVWPASFGLFLLSLFGFRFLGEIALKGLYALTRK